MGVWTRLTGKRSRGSPPAALEYFVTLCPSFPHFPRFARDGRLAGIRINSAALSPAEVVAELQEATATGSGTLVPLWFDVKGRQLRITEVLHNPTHIDIRLNHPIRVNTPTPVLFKAGAESGLLVGVEEDGTRLIFGDGRTYGPASEVKPGDSLHIRDKSLVVSGSQFIPAELEKIATVTKAGFTRYCLSYVQCQRDVDEFRELVGRDSQVVLKIEDPKGLQYVATGFRKTPNVSLMAARGDLYVELEKPHDILPALRLIAGRDPEAMVGSRIMLSMIHDSVPSCADFSEMAWLYDIGFRRMLLCDELCMYEPLLARALSAMQAFRRSYATVR
jgi:pyruvate kinase